MSDLVERLVADLARATGQPLATVRLAYGIAPGRFECGDCGHPWVSHEAAVTCCTDAYPTD